MQQSLRRTRAFLYLAAVAVGLAQAWANRFYIEPDGVNYLDIANAYLKRDWQTAVNAYWSPLWSWLLALALWVIRPSPYWESTLVHAVNFVVYLLALAAFAFFLNEVAALSSNEADGHPESQSLTPFAWLVFGYLIATHVLLVMIGGRLDTPDLCVAALFFLATGVLIRMRRENNGWRLYAALGAILGVAYLAKTVMFLLAFVFLLCSLFAMNGFRRAIPRALVALLVFLTISGPFLAVLSKAKGRLTFGESGRLNYAWNVKGSFTAPNRHRHLSDELPAYEYSSPIGGTYPPFFDPTYWQEGLQPQFEWKAQFRHLISSARMYFLILSSQRALAVAVLVLLFFGGDWRGFWNRVAGLWMIWLPSAATIFLYSLVYVEPRYLAASVVVLWCSVLAAIRLPAADVSRRLFNAMALAVAIALSMTIATLTAENVATILRRPPHVDWIVTESLHRRGLRPGDTVAVLGQEERADYWARLAQVKVVADLPADALDSFWQTPTQKQVLLFDAFASTGAKFLVTHSKPPAAHSEGWQDLENTGYFALSLVNRAPHAGPHPPRLQN